MACYISETRRIPLTVSDAILTSTIRYGPAGVQYHRDVMPEVNRCNCSREITTFRSDAGTMATERNNNGPERSDTATVHHESCGPRFKKIAGGYRRGRLRLRLGCRVRLDHCFHVNPPRSARRNCAPHVYGRCLLDRDPHRSSSNP